MTAHEMARMSAPSAAAMVGSDTMNTRVPKPEMNCPIMALTSRSTSVRAVIEEGLAWPPASDRGGNHESETEQGHDVGGDDAGDTSLRLRRDYGQQDVRRPARAAMHGDGLAEDFRRAVTRVVVLEGTDPGE